MGKLIMRLVIFSILAVVILPIYLKGPDGYTFKSLTESLPKLDSITEWFKEKPQGWQTLGGLPSKTEVYKWQDEEGVWHFSDEPSPNANAEQIQVDPNANLVQMPKPATDDEYDADTNKSKALTSLPTPSTIPLDKIPKLIEDTQNLQSLVDEHRKTLDKEL